MPNFKILSSFPSKKVLITFLRLNCNETEIDVRKTDWIMLKKGNDFLFVKRFYFLKGQKGQRSHEKHLLGNPHFRLK